MSKNLVIVESPAKAKTIQKYLGKDFEVKSSFGHIRDLPKKGMGIDLKTFTPDYEVSADKKKLVTELKAAVKKAEIVWLASDEDREGEAIAWHLAQELKLKEENTKRIFGRFICDLYCVCRACDRLCRHPAACGERAGNLADQERLYSRQVRQGGG